MSTIFQVKHSMLDEYGLISPVDINAGFHKSIISNHIFCGDHLVIDFDYMEYKWTTGLRVECPFLNHTVLTMKGEIYREFSKKYNITADEYSLECDGEYVIINPTTLIDLNIDKSSLEKYNSGKIKNILKYSFSEIIEFDVFRIRQLNSRIYCTDNFRNFITLNNIRGLEFLDIEIV